MKDFREIKTEIKDLFENQNEIENLEQISQRLQLILGEIEGKLEALFSHATHDSLTGLYRREVLVKSIEDDLKEGHTGGLIILDIDHFKKINDQQGHMKGDEILIGVSRKLEKILPAPISIARLGGEEFGIWIPAATPAELSARTEWIRASIANTPISGVTVTVSMGWALDQKRWFDFYRIADQRLYMAKRNGRNQVWKEVGNYF